MTNCQIFCVKWLVRYLHDLTRGLGIPHGHLLTPRFLLGHFMRIVFDHLRFDLFVTGGLRRSRTLLKYSQPRDSLRWDRNASRTPANSHPFIWVSFELFSLLKRIRRKFFD